MLVVFVCVRLGPVRSSVLFMFLLVSFSFFFLSLSRWNTFFAVWIVSTLRDHHHHHHLSLLNTSPTTLSAILVRPGRRCLAPQVSPAVSQQPTRTRTTATQFSRNTFLENIDHTLQNIGGDRLSFSNYLILERQPHHHRRRRLVATSFLLVLSLVFGSNR